METLIESENSDPIEEPEEASGVEDSSESHADSPEEVLKEALENHTPRLFGISAHGVRGRTGPEEEETIARDLNMMREGSEAIGQELGMETIGYVAIYEENQAVAYRYDSDSNPRNPHLIAGMVNTRMPMRALLKVLGDAS